LIALLQPSESKLLAISLISFRFHFHHCFSDNHCGERGDISEVGGGPHMGTGDQQETTCHSTVLKRQHEAMLAQLVVNRQ
jgi:hypothetical protein